MPEAVVSGRVVDERGQPIAGVTVSVTDQSAQPLPDGSGKLFTPDLIAERHSVSTGADGAYRLGDGPAMRTCASSIRCIRRRRPSRLP